MNLSEQEFAVLDAMVRLHTDHGEYLAAETIAGDLADMDRSVVANVLGGLARKQFVAFDDRGYATITEFGGAALKAM